jgi:hypothetical protein
MFALLASMPANSRRRRREFVAHVAFRAARVTRDLNAGFLEERLQPIVQLDATAGDLVFAAHRRPPQALLGVWTKP